ncbi:Fc.00g114320.m01.CDS01 [Cosmosporella sp. VM-42]
MDDGTARPRRQRRSRTGCSRFRVYTGASVTNNAANHVERPRRQDVVSNDSCSNGFQIMHTDSPFIESPSMTGLDAPDQLFNGRESSPSPGSSAVRDLGRVLLQLGQLPSTSANLPAASPVQQAMSPSLSEFATAPSDIASMDPETNEPLHSTSSSSTATGGHNLNYSQSMDFSTNTPLRTPESACAAEPVNEFSMSSPGVNTKVAETNDELPFFLRHFSETMGKWMDLFDLDCFYHRDVPMLALDSSLLMYSACAVAAKQLSKVCPPSDDRLVRSPIQQWSNSRGKDYSWYSTKYYDAAISLLLERVSELSNRGARDGSSNIASHNGNHTAGSCERALEHIRDHRHANQGCSDEVVVAATILSVYEFLSASGKTWSEHLDGIRSFIQLSDEAGFYSFQAMSPTSRISPIPPSLLRAAFWNFARQDFLAALINCTKTRLDTDSPIIWRHMGLNLDVDGILIPGNQSDAGTAPNSHANRADVLSNALIWLLSKLANFVAMFTEATKAVDKYGRLEPPRSTEHLESSWASLNHDFEGWFHGLPSFFRPCYRVRLKDVGVDKCTGCQHRLEPLVRHETWYCNSMCASTMQSYHMAQILLLIHKPSGFLAPATHYRPRAPSGSNQGILSDALTNFHQMIKALQHHAVEICAIALSRPDEAARIHMLQPLYFAGRCLDNPVDRAIVVQLLECIEQELGWSTKYRVDNLLNEWNEG